jgi:hypothetical protein
LTGRALDRYEKRKIMRNNVTIVGAAWSGLIVLCCTTYGSVLPALKAKAASDFGCSEGSVQNETFAEGFEKVKGCGKEDIYAWDSGQEKWISALDRAEFDLSCKRERLTSKHLGARDVGVTGCGKKATYVLHPASGWVMNSTAK